MSQLESKEIDTQVARYLKLLTDELDVNEADYLEYC